MDNDIISWKLLDVKVEQLKDAVRSARLPFFLGLSVSFTWLLCLYNFYFSYVHVIFDRFDTAKATAAHPCTHRFIERFHPILFNAHRRTGSPSVAGPELANTCKEILDIQYRALLNQDIDFWKIRVPVLNSAITVFDLGIIAQLGVCIIGLWFLYSSRRENHSLRAFVDVIAPYVTNAEPKIPLFGKTDLYPQDSEATTRQYLFAYQAVSQRFLFLTSRREPILLLITSILIMLPAIAAGCEIVSDFSDAARWRLADVELRKLFSAVFGLGVIAIYSACLTYELRTSTLLHAWYLACRDVWSKELASARPSPVHVIIGEEASPLPLTPPVPPSPPAPPVVPPPPPPTPPAPPVPLPPDNSG